MNIIINPYTKLIIIFLTQHTFMSIAFLTVVDIKAKHKTLKCMFYLFDKKINAIHKLHVKH